MKKWIRWQGVWVFVCVVVLMSFFWMVFIDGIVERSIETYGTKALGAKVELKEVNLDLYPTGLTLKGVEIANPDKPMENIVAVAQIDLSLDTLKLFRRKIIIDNMSLSGIRLNTQRKTSGVVDFPKARSASVTSKPSAKGFCEKSGLPVFKVTDIKKILLKEKLNSLDLVRSLQKNFQSEETSWQKRLSQIPGKEQFDEYRRRTQKPKSGPGGFLNLARDIASIQKDLQRDLTRIKNAQNDFELKKSGLTKRFNQAAQAPLKDVKHLKQKYGLSSQGLENLSTLVFGPKLCNGLQKAIAWHERLKPLMNRSRDKGGVGREDKPLRGVGTDVRFREYAPVPDFLIRQMKVSFQLEAGDLSGTIENVTPDQDIIGIPLTFKFLGDKTKRLGSFKMEGIVDRTSPANPRDLVTVQMKDYMAEQVSLSQTPELPINLIKGRMNLDLKGTLTGKTLAADVSAALKSARFSSEPGKGSGAISRSVCATLANVSSFNVSAKINGTLDEYDIQLASDLDQILKSAVANMIKTEAAKFNKALSKAVLEKVNGPLNQLKAQKIGFDAIGTQLTNRLNMGNGLLGSMKRPF